MVIKRIDRGVSSEAGTIRSTYRKYRERAVIKGIPDTERPGTMMKFESVAQRFYDDRNFRKDMEEHDWHDETVCLIDAIALTPALENQGRTREERAVYEDFYNVYEKGGLVSADPTRLARPQNYAAVERCREEHEHWGTDSRRLQIEKERQENKGKGKGTKGKFAVPPQAIRESKGRGKGQSKSDLPDRVYQ